MTICECHSSMPQYVFLPLSPNFPPSNALNNGRSNRHTRLQHRRHLAAHNVTLSVDQPAPLPALT